MDIMTSIWSVFMHLILLTITSSSLRLGGNEVDRISLLAFKAEIMNDARGILSTWNESLHFCEWPGITCGRRHQRVTKLELQSSQLKGHLSPHMGNLSFLKIFNLQNNGFIHNIPKEIGRLSRLQMLHLDDNFFSGDLDFLSPLVNCNNLELLDISGNSFQDSLPESISNLSTKLKVMRLGRNKIFGTIPIGIGNLTNLRALGFEANLLGGSIPSSIGLLRHLQNLNLSFNDFEGAVPMQGVFKNTSALSIKGNTRLCGGMSHLGLPTCISNQESEQASKLEFEQESKQNSEPELSPLRKLTIASVCEGVGVVILMLCSVLLYRSRKTLCLLILCRLRKARVKSSGSGSLLGVSLLKVSYGDLFKATVGFSSRNLIGAGSFGSVYRGILNQEERIVAVKVFNLQRSKAFKSFVAECEALKNVRHRNIVKQLTACSSIDFQGNDFKALVYEFMANGSLEEQLHTSAHSHRAAGAPNVQGYLKIIQRVNIAIDVASALDYLQNHCQIPIVHRDLKPSNVLLDSDMTAHVGDFGLAKCLPDAFRTLASHESASIAIKGSIGYTAPEYGLGRKASKYGDVYSYGVLLLEMLTGKRPTDDKFKDGLNLHKFVLMALPGRVEEICDPLLLRSVQNEERQRVDECLVSMARIGVACSADLPRERMEISNVVVELNVMRDVLVGTRMPREHI